MIKRIPKWYIVLLIVYVISLTTSLLVCMVRDSKLPEKEYAKPQIITNPISFYESPITEIVDDGIYIYALVDKHDGYIQVYDLEGNYHSTISLHSASISGTFSMTVLSDTLYVEDCDQNIYIFKNGNYQKFISHAKLTPELEQVMQSKYSGRFALHQGSIWRFDLEEPNCIVQRSPLAIFHQYGIDDVIPFAFILLTGFIMIKYHKNEQ